jgi:hypothetical protein
MKGSGMEKAFLVRCVGLTVFQALNTSNKSSQNISDLNTHAHLQMIQLKPYPNQKHCFISY